MSSRELAMLSIKYRIFHLVRTKNPVQIYIIGLPTVEQLKWPIFNQIVYGPTNRDQKNLISKNTIIRVNHSLHCELFMKVYSKLDNFNCN